MSSARPPANACAQCGLPLAAELRGSAPIAERTCCIGCFLAQRLSHRSLETRTDRLLSRVVLSGFLAMGVMVFSLALYGSVLHEQDELEGARALAGVFRLGALLFATPVMVLLGSPLFDGVLALRRYLSAESLILSGALAAWATSVWNTFRGGGEVYFDTATMVLVFYSLGRWLDVRTRERATQELLRVAPEREAPVARLDPPLQHETAVRADEIRVGDRLRLRPGEIVPVDGRVASGRSFVDTSVLTGEAQPRSTGPGDCVFAGTTLLDGTLEVDATAVVGTRMRDEIARLLQAALASRGQLMRIADRLAAWLVPLVLVLAVLVVVARWRTSGPEQACLSGLAVVLISCPCALGIATPLAFWRAMGAAWRRGVLVRGGETLEALARVRRVAFDKTGTLTSGEFELEHVHAAAGFDARTVLAQAAALELGSEHPIARSLRRAARASGVDAAPAPRDFEALPGVGVCGTIEGQRLRLIGRDDARFPGATVIALEDRDGERARFVLRSRPRPEAAGVLARLRALGCELEILTGDGADAAQAVARELDVAVAARLTPAQKVERVSSARVPLAFVGDGLNDAAALAAADVGISVAGSASTSLAAAHVNLLEPGLHALPDLLDLARAAVRAARLNLAWAFGYNAIGLYLAATGRLSPIFAASAMVVSSLFSVLNSSRAIPLRRPMRAESASAAGPAVEPTRAARFALLRAPAEAQ